MSSKPGGLGKSDGGTILDRHDVGIGMKMPVVWVRSMGFTPGPAKPIAVFEHLPGVCSQTAGYWSGEKDRSAWLAQAFRIPCLEEVDW